MKRLQNKKTGTFGKKIFVLDGSLSLEAGIVLPIFMFAVITILSLIEVVRAYGDIEANLHKAGKEIALYSCALDVAGTDIGDTASSLISTALVDTYSYAEVSRLFTSENGQSTMVVPGGISPLNFIMSKSETGSDIIDLCVMYNVKPIYNFFGIYGSQMANRCYLHAWTGYGGYEGDGDDIGYDEEMVYITETGTVYHRSASCSYLDLSISSISAGSLEGARNYGGGKYGACKYCGNKSNVSTYYITNYGDSYHTSLACSGLKRTVVCVPISQVGDKGPCSKCGGGHR